MPEQVENPFQSQGIVTGFHYATNNRDRVKYTAHEVIDADSGEVEPKLSELNNIAPVHKAVVAIGGRDFLVYSWTAAGGPNLQRNKSLARIRRSTIFHGEVLIFVKGATARVPFLSDPFTIPKRLVEEAVGGYITTLLNARDAGREPPAKILITL